MSADSPSVGERLAELGADLATIEINTILKTCITGTKMPMLEHALMDISNSFWEFLLTAGADPRASNPEWTWDQNAHAGWSAWHDCRILASTRRDALILELKVLPAAAHDLRLRFETLIGQCQRIVSSCDQIKAVLYDTSKDKQAVAAGKRTYCCHLEYCRIDRDENGAVRHTHSQTPADLGAVVTYAASGPGKENRWIPAGPRQMAVVRKIWEVRLEEIAMQTVVQLDGDVVTRIQPGAIENRTLQRIHHEGVQTAQAFWNDIIDIAFRLFDSAANFVKRA